MVVGCDVCGKEIASAPTRSEAVRLAGKAGDFSRRGLALHFCSKSCRKSDVGVELCSRPTAREVKDAEEAARRDEWNARQAALVAQAADSVLDTLGPAELARLVPRSQP